MSFNVKEYKVTFPCKVGDTLFYVHKDVYKDIPSFHILEGKVTALEQMTHGTGVTVNYFVCHNNNAELTDRLPTSYYHNIGAFGSCVFYDFNQAKERLNEVVFEKADIIFE